MASFPESTSGISFLDLAFELREMILALSFTLNCFPDLLADYTRSLGSIRCVRTGGVKFPSRRWTEVFPCRNLLVTCRQVHAEATRILYANEFEAGAGYCSHIRKYKLLSQGPFHTYRILIREIRLGYHSNTHLIKIHWTELTSDVILLTTQFPNLKTLKVSVRMEDRYVGARVNERARKILYPINSVANYFARDAQRGERELDIKALQHMIMVYSIEGFDFPNSLKFRWTGGPPRELDKWGEYVNGVFNEAYGRAREAKGFGKVVKDTATEG
jgi:hypothetical protein